jgi:hypothetical protein
MTPTTELVPARKPIPSTEVTLADMSRAMMPAGKMTSANVTTPEVSTAMAAAEVTTAVSPGMTASAVTAAAMTAAAMTAATVTTAALAPRNVGCQSQCHDCNRQRQNPSESRLHGVLPVSVENANWRTFKPKSCCKTLHRALTQRRLWRQRGRRLGVPK